MDSQKQTPESLRAKARELQTEEAKGEREARDTRRSFDVPRLAYLVGALAALLGGSAVAVR